ncbi:MAG: Phytoene desaturase (lycopene-forming) [Candidatus Thorarchaeota archaeon]|nr:MAG: Phytoene desaturase (lycopene-forming) [Candidatus Thorarchaeota archaeon]
MNTKKNKEIVVIGGGLGGLAASIRMQAAGHSVTLLEKRHQLGGRAGVFERKGYVFDTGPTILTPPMVVDDLFQTAGKETSEYVQLEKVSPKYRLYFSDGSKMDYSGEEENISQIEKMSPKDVEGYKKFLKRVKPIYELGFEKFGSMPFESIFQMAKMGPAGLKHKAYRSVYGFVSSYVKDPRLRIAMSFNPLFIGGNPFTTTAIYTLITYIEEKHGVWWVKGGTHKLVEAMGQLINDLGGQYHLNSEVSQIHVTDKKRVKSVETIDGSVYDADIVISNADTAHTYMSLIDSKYRKKNKDKRYRKAKYSMSLFMTYFGVKKKYEDMVQHSIVFGPRYKDLIEDIFKKHIVPDDFSTYLHIPTRNDQSLAPPGCEAMYACTPVTNLEGEVNWEEKKDEFRDHILGTLDKSVLPGLLDNLEVAEVFTPADYEREFHSFRGSGFQLQPILLQSGSFRPHNRSKDVKGLYLVGAGTHPGAGVPSVIMSADITSQCIFEDIEKEKI